MLSLLDAGKRRCEEQRNKVCEGRDGREKKKKKKRKGKERNERVDEDGAVEKDRYNGQKPSWPLFKLAFH